MAMQAQTKIVASVAMKDGYGVVVHGEGVVYEGTVKGAIDEATKRVGAFILTSYNTKQKLDEMIDRQNKGKPIAH